MGFCGSVCYFVVWEVYFCCSFCWGFFFPSFSSFKTLWLLDNYINILGDNSEEPCEAVSNFLDKLGG